MKKNVLLFFIAFILTTVGNAMPVIPVIASFSPQNGIPGSSIVISGTGFSSTATDNIVYFGGVKAKVTAATSTSLTVTVPLGAATDYISVTTGGRTAYSKSQFVAIFNCGPATLDTNSFVRPASIYVAGSSNNPTIQGSTIGDLDGDGKLDIILPHFSDSFVTIYRNISSPGSLDSNSFKKINMKVRFKSAFQLEVGDVNGDGKLDLVVGCFSIDSVHIFLNNSTPGTISLTEVISLGFIAGSSATRIRINDLDADGKPEIIVANRNRRVSIFKNKISGTIDTSDFARTDLTVGTSAAMNDIAVADMNLDGKPDLIVPDYNATTLHVFLNNGNLSFTDNTVTTPFNGTWGISAADLDGDGKTDIAGGLRNNNAFFYFRNTTSSSGTFSISSIDTILIPGTTSSFQPIYTTLADINGDGKADLIAANLNSANAYIVQNNSTSGTISFGRPFHLKKATGAINVCVGDLDQDGAPDIFLPDNSKGGFSFRCKNSLLVSPDSVTASAGSDSATLSYRIAGGVPTQYKITWDSAATAAGFTNTSLASLPASPISLSLSTTAPGGIYHGSIAMSDGSCIGIGIPFTVTLTEPHYAPTDLLLSSDSVDENLPRFSFVGRFTTVDSNANDSHTYNLTSGVGDDDNRAFVIVGDSLLIEDAADYETQSSYAIRVTTTDASGLFFEKSFVIYIRDVVEPPSISSFSPASGAPGNSVVITGTNFNATASNNIVYFGGVQAQVTAASYTSLTVTIPVGAANDYISVTTNGRIAHSTTKFVSTFACGTSVLDTNSFVRIPSIYKTGTSPYSSSPSATNLADLDGDGKLDIILPHQYDQYLTIYRNTGSPGSLDSNSFDKININIPNIYIASSQVGDINGDGKPEVILGNSNNDSVYIFQNNSTPGNINLVLSARLLSAGSSNGYTMMPHVYRIRIRDLDADGKPEVIVVNSTPYLSIFKNTISGTITSADLTRSSMVLSDVLHSAIYDVDVADMNRDGKPDLIFPEWNPISPLLHVYTNNGNLSFTDNFRWTNNLYNLAVTDLDGDSKPDVITFNSTLSKYSIYQNTTASGNFSFATSPITFASSGSYISYIETADLNGDGKVDIIGAGASSSNPEIIKNNSTPGTISLGTPFNLGYSRSPMLVVGDLDQDAAPDLFMPDQSNGGFSFRNRSVLSITPDTNLSAPAGYDTLSISYTKGSRTPTQYQVTWDSAASAAGMTAIPLTNISASPISMPVSNMVSPGVYHGTIAVSDGTCTGPDMPFTATITEREYAPAFISADTQQVSTCKNYPAFSLDSMLAVFDSNNGQTLTWSVASAPLHGTLVANYNHSSNADTLLPSGITYQPATDFIGSDQVKIYVSDGFMKDSVLIQFTINNLPDIAVADTLKICPGTTHTDLQYTILTGPYTTYSIVWDSVAIQAGFSNDIDLAFPSSPAISVSVPSNTSSGSYTGRLHVNNINHCSSGDRTFVIKISDLLQADTTSIFRDTISLGQAPAAFNTIVSPTGGTGIFTYLWQYSTDNLSWNDAPGINNTNTYQASILMQNAYFRRQVKDECGTIIYDNTHIITVTNEAPGTPDDRDSDPNEVEENAANGTIVGLTVLSIDPEAQSVTYKLTDNADGRFAIDSITGIVTVADGSRLDYDQTPAYTIIVQASDGVNTSIDSFIISLINVNEPPVFLSLNDSFSVAENTNLVDTLKATDPDAGTTLVFSIVGGPDHSRFIINGPSHRLIFERAPDFEHPSDTDSDNVYLVTVKVSDGTNSITKDLTIYVTNVNEAPYFNNGVSTLTSVCQRSRLNMSYNLRVTDVDVNQTLTWSTATPPNHGSLSNFPATASSTGALMTLNNVFYTPDSGFIGTDTFFLKISDGQASATMKMMINVWAYPTLDSITNKTWCSGVAVDSISFSGSGGASYFSWSNNNTLIGLAASGTGNIASFTPVNTTNSPITATIQVIPYSEHCMGTAGSFTITVNPVSTVNTNPDQTLCNGSPTTSITFSNSVMNTIYRWTNSDSTIGLAANGTGDIPSFTAINNGTTPVTASIIITPSFENCAGTPDTLTITVNPTPSVQATSDQIVCNNTSTHTVLFNGRISGAAYHWTNDQSSIGLAASGTGRIESFTAINHSNSTVIATIIVTPSKLGCAGAADTFAIRVNPIPSVDTISDQAFCNNANTTAISFSSPVSGTTYNWSNSDSSISLALSGTGDLASFNATNSTNTPVTGSIMVTPKANGCVGAADTFTIRVNPTPSVDTLSNQTLCNQAATTAITFSGAVSGTTYDWTNDKTSIGLAASGTGNIASFTATNTTASPVTATITVTPKANGCTGTAKTFTITVNPTPSVNATTDQTLCNSASTTVVTFSGPVNSTIYNWTNDLSSIGLVASGSGDIASFHATNTGSSAVIAGIIVTPVANGCTGIADTFNIKVNPTPTVNTLSNQTLCNNSSTTAVSFSGAVGGTTYEWTNDKTSIGLAASGTGDIASFTATNTTALPITATITVTPKANGCAGPAQSFTITVNPTPSVNTISNQALCHNTSTTAVSFSGLVNGTTYSWTNDKTSIGLTASGTGDIASFTATNTTSSPIVATITVTPSKNGCIGTAKTFTITVNPIPTVNAVSNQTLCNSSSTTAISFSGAVSGTSYAWTNTKTSIGLAASGTGDIASFTATNTTSSAVTATLTITPSANGCSGIAKTMDITVNPTPDVNTVSDQVVCNTASTTVISFSGSVSGTTYSWTNDNSSIGLATDGTGDISSFTATNTSTNTVTATITVTPTANGCTGTVKTFTITVKPSPNLTAISNETLCNGASTTAVSFNSDLSGTTYAWTNDETSIGLATSGSGNIASFTATNTTHAAVNANITVVPTTDGCIGDSKNFSWTVNPTAVVDAVTSQTICNGTGTTAISFSGAVDSTTYTWINTDASIGLGANGNGDIASFTAGNSTHAPVTSTITVTPTAKGCAGSSETFTYTVNPTPDVTSVSNQVLCNSFSTSAISFTGSVNNTTYDWVNTAASIGLAANGTGDIAAFTASNNTNAPVTSTIVVVPTANTCAGNSATFTITVNPTPIVDATTDQILCVNANTSAVTFNSPVSGTTYAWTNDKTSIGLDASGTSDIASFTASNSTTDPVTALILVTPSANGCVGPVDSFQVTVNPAPMLSSTLTPASICDSNVFSYTPTSLTAGSGFAWSRSSVAGISNAAATGMDDPSERLINTTAQEVNVIYAYTLTANNCSNTQSVTVPVKPTPRLSGATSAIVCSNSEFDYTPASATTGTGFTWTRATVMDITPATGNGTGNISETLTNATLAPIDLTYQYTLTAAGCVHTEALLLTVNPTPAAPVISVKPSATLCTNTQYINIGAANVEPAGVNYTWSAANAELYATGAGKQYCLVNFNNPGTAIVTLTANVPGIGCIAKDTFAVEVGTSAAQHPTVIYFNDHFVCRENTVTAYQWGYDDKVTLAPTALTSEVNQDYFNSAPDLANKSYWVITMKDGCAQKTYYNLATGVNVAQAETGFIKLYPNPASSYVDVEINSRYTDLTLEIVDMLGKTVGSVPAADQKTRIQVDNLALGMYFINCYHNGEKVGTQRFIIQK